MAPQGCSESRCDRLHYARGLCNNCDRKVQRRGGFDKHPRAKIAPAMRGMIRTLRAKVRRRNRAPLASSCPACQQVVDLDPKGVISAHAAPGLEVKTVVARGQPVQRHCLVEHVSERRQLRHGYSSMFKCEVPWVEVSQGADAFARAHVLLRYLVVLPSTQDCGRRRGPHSKSLDFVLPIAFGGVRFVAGRVRRPRCHDVVTTHRKLVARTPVDGYRLP